MKRKFDAKLLDHPPRPSAGHVMLFDTKASGLAMRIGARGTPVFQVVARDPDGREKRVTFARWTPHGGIATDGEALDLDGIRAAAIALRDRMRRGEVLTSGANARPATSCTTLGRALELHIEAKRSAGKLGARAADEYRSHVRLYFGDWVVRPLASISRTELYERHRRIGEKHGTYAANAALRTFRAAYRRAERLDPEMPACPTVAIEWFEELRRDPGLREEDLRGRIENARRCPGPDRGVGELSAARPRERRRSLDASERRHCSTAAELAARPHR